MANEGDLAHREQEFFENIAIQNARNAAKNHLRPNGICHYCKGPAKHPKVFCDDYCADDHAYEQKRRRAIGV
jgi:hypothetical protein